MKLTRKRAFEKAFETAQQREPYALWTTLDVELAAQRGVDYGIVLGLQMAAEKIAANRNPRFFGTSLGLMIERRLKKLEKAQ